MQDEVQSHRLKKIITLTDCKIYVHIFQGVGVIFKHGTRVRNETNSM